MVLWAQSTTEGYIRAVATAKANKQQQKTGEDSGLRQGKRVLDLDSMTQDNWTQKKLSVLVK